MSPRRVFTTEHTLDDQVARPTIAQALQKIPVHLSARLVTLELHAAGDIDIG